MKKKLIIAIVAILSLFGSIDNPVRDTVVGGFTSMRGFATLQVDEVNTAIVEVSSVSFSTIATTPVTLIADPGTGRIIHLISVTGYRKFSSESWAFGVNKSIDNAPDIRYGETGGLEVIASFSKGFIDGGVGPTGTTASPSYETRYGIDGRASASSALVLTASSSHTIDGDTSFVFYLLYRILDLQ